MRFVVLYLIVSLFLFIPRETRGYRFQLFHLSVCPGSCPGYISESTQWKVFKFHIRIKHQWKVCNVVVLFDLMKNCENDRILKTYEILGNILPRVQAVSPKVCKGVLLSIRIRIKHILKVCNVVFWIKSMKNCQSYDFCKFIKFDNILVNIWPRVQAVSPKAYIGVLLSIHREIEHIWKVCNVVFWIEFMENCQNDRLL